MTSSLTTIVNVLHGVYRLATEGFGLWVVRALLMALVAVEPKQIVVAAVTVLFLAAIIVGILRFLFDALVEFTVRCIDRVIQNKK